jgi:multiple sugar transport system ATP-binding protein
MGQIQLQALRKEYDDIVAVNDLSLTLADGEFLVLLGPSGCGKSTTLRMIAGLEKPTSGEVFADEEAVTTQSPAERDFAMVFQEVALYPHMTVKQNIASPLRADGESSETIDRRVRETAEMLDIAQLLDRRPSELSGGQQQRVAIGRALVREPRAFLLDEPFSKLDQKLRVQLQKELKRLQEQTGVTTVFVTHNQEEAMVLADRIAVMKGGSLQQVDTPAELYANPANEFVAEFIGNPMMNFFDIQYRNGRLLVDDIDYGDAVAPEVGERARSMAARPDDVHGDPMPADDRLVAEVELIEMRGSTTYLICELNGRELTLLRDDRTATVSEGDVIGLDFDFESTNFFDQQGELVERVPETSVPSQVSE